MQRFKYCRQRLFVVGIHEATPTTNSRSGQDLLPLSRLCETDVETRIAQYQHAQHIQNNAAAIKAAATELLPQREPMLQLLVSTPPVVAAVVTAFVTVGPFQSPCLLHHS